MLQYPDEPFMFGAKTKENMHGFRGKSNVEKEQHMIPYNSPHSCHARRYDIYPIEQCGAL